MNKGNELIAKYMGLAYCDEGWYTNSERICDKDGLRYHISMDALLPVLMKIKSDFNMVFTINNYLNGYFCVIELKDYNYAKKFTGFGFVMAVWLAVVDVIDWMIERGIIVL